MILWEKPACASGQLEGRASDKVIAESGLKCKYGSRMCIGFLVVKLKNVFCVCISTFLALMYWENPIFTELNMKKENKTKKRDNKNTFSWTSPLSSCIERFIL